MHTLKKFIKYYGPYKAVFFIDLSASELSTRIDPNSLNISTRSPLYLVQRRSPEFHPVEFFCQLPVDFLRGFFPPEPRFRRSGKSRAKTVQRHSFLITAGNPPPRRHLAFFRS